MSDTLQLDPPSELESVFEEGLLSLYEDTIKDIIRKLEQIEENTSCFLETHRNILAQQTTQTDVASKNEIKEALKKLRNLIIQTRPFSNEFLDLLYKIGAENIQPESIMILRSMNDSITNQLDLITVQIDTCINDLIGFIGSLIKERMPK